MKAIVVNPNETTRAEAFELWMQAPQPMVTRRATLHADRFLRLLGEEIKNA